MKKVFISYNHKDEAFVKKLKKALEEEDIGVTIDYEAVQFGDNLDEFLERSVQMTDFTISVISRNSLQSVWVIAEALETLMYEKVQAKKKLVPIFLDREFFEPTFQGELVSSTEQAIDRFREEIDELSRKYLPTRALDREKARLIELRYHIDTILRKLRESLTGNFSSEQKFQDNFPKLAQLIKENADNPEHEPEANAGPPEKPEPTPFMSFVNRKMELERVVLYPRLPYFVFDGPAGYGKTALLKEIEREFTRRPWACQYVSLAEQTTLRAIVEYLHQQFRLEKPEHAENPQLAGNELGYQLAKKHDQEGTEGVVCLFDLDQEPWDQRLQTLNTLVDEFVPAIYQGLSRTSSYFHTTPNSFRVVFAGRYLASHLERETSALTCDPVRLTPFTYEVALALCRTVIESPAESSDFAAHLLFFSGGHPRCMARILEKFREKHILPWLFFEQQRQQIEQIAYQEAFWVRDSMSRDWRAIFDTLCLYRRLDRPLLDVLLKHKPEWTYLAEDGYDLAMKLKHSYLMDWADPSRRHLHDDITRRLLSIRLSHDLPEQVFQSRTEEARGFCAERLAQTDHDRGYWAIETLFEFLQGHLADIHSPATRQNLRQRFWTQELPDTLRALFLDRDPRPEKESLSGLIEADREFRFTLNYYLRDERYDDSPYQQLIAAVETSCSHHHSGGD